eukprot:COSAG05_NODE_15335_length_372_cov_0.754579_1_plen_87_part_10
MGEFNVIANITAFCVTLALRNFEEFQGLEEGSAQLEDVHNSELGIVGWAYGKKAPITNTGSTGLSTAMMQNRPPPMEEYVFLTVVIF